MSESDTRGQKSDPTDSSSSTESDTNRNAAATSPHATDLTAFQRDILAILADEARYGLAIKEALQEYMGEEVNHGRLYPEPRRARRRRAGREERTRQANEPL